MRESIERFCLVLSSVAAIVVAGIAINREFFQESSGSSPRGAKVGDWQSYVRDASSVGVGPVSMVVFSDYQCPSCGALDRNIESILEKGDRALRVSFRHYPLEQIHPAARGAAILAECAIPHGSFSQVHHLLFAMQDSIPFLEAEDVARMVGIADKETYTRCTADAKSHQQIDKDMEDGDRLRVTATPTILLNGRKYVGALSAVELDSLLRIVGR